MKLKNLALLLILLLNSSICLAVPVGNDLELIPAPRNLGINTNQASQKLTVNGAIALTNFSLQPSYINSQPIVFVQGDGLYYSSLKHPQKPFRLDTNEISDGIFTNPQFKGNLRLLDGAKFEPFSVNGAITATVFQGGIFKGDGSELTGIVPSSLKAPDGSPNPALQVDNFGRIGIGTTTPQEAFLHVKTTNGSRLLAQHTNESFWSEFSTAGVNNSGTTIRKWSVGSTGDARTSALGGPNKFYIYQYSDKNDAIVNQYRMVIDSNGNTGIGTLNPSEKLEVAGNIKAVRFIGNGSGLTNISTSGITNLSIDSLVDAKTGSTSIFLAEGSGNASPGAGSTALGINSLKSATSQTLNNTAVGYAASMNPTSGNGNVSVGAESFMSGGGSFNTMLGTKTATTLRGDRNIVIGAETTVPNGNYQLNVGNLLTGKLPEIGLVNGSNSGILNINGNTAIKNGHLSIKDGTQRTGKLLGSVNNNGFASWVEPDQIYAGQWKLVHTENFNDVNNIQNWRIGTQTTGLTYQCGTEKILGGYNISGKDKSLEKSFNLTNFPHNEVKITYELYTIDSWDEIDAASLEINNKRYQASSTWYVDRNRQHLCGNPNDSSSQLYFDGISYEEVVSSTTNDLLNLKFIGHLDEALTNESFGIDNIKIYVRTIDDSIKLAEVPYSPPPAKYYQANSKNCSTFCSSIGKTNVADPQGFFCASGESKSLNAIEKKNLGEFSFTYGCWADSNCSVGTNTGNAQSVGAYCYRNGQTRDNDGTDITVACHCQ